MNYQLGCNDLYLKIRKLHSWQLQKALTPGDMQHESRIRSTVMQKKRVENHNNLYFEIK